MIQALGLKRFDRDKRSSLFGLSEVKIFYNFGPRSTSVSDISLILPNGSITEISDTTGIVILVPVL
jgi:hypothetical protein